MAITEIPEVKPGAPINLTETAEVTPGNPINTTEVAEVTPGNPLNTTEIAAIAPGNPSNTTEIAAIAPGNPSNTTEVAAIAPGNPTNTTEIAEISPGNPTNLTEVPNNMAGNPTNLTEVADAGIDRTLSTLFNFNAALGLPDSVTYSRSSSASYLETYKGPLGRYQKRLTNDYVGSVTNLALYSEQFDNAIWPKTNTNIVRLSDGTYKMTETAITGEHRIDQTYTAANNLTFTVEAKASNNTRFLFLRIGSAEGSIFDLVNGVIVSNQGTSISSIIYKGNGFYECSIFIASPSVNIVRINLRNDPAGSSTYAGDGISGIIIKRAQLTASAKPLPYVKTLDTSVSQTFTANPRYEEKGLLVEGSSTNLLANSESIGGTGWSLNGAPTITSNASLAPDGSFSADRFETTGFSSGAFKGVSTAAGATYTASVYLKNFNNTTVMIEINANTARARFNSITKEVTSVGGSTTNTKIEEVANGWVRCSLTFVTDSISNTVRLYGETDGDFLIWGAQFEALPFATSYIRTEGSAVSRGGERFDVPVYLGDDSGSMHYSAESYGPRAGVNQNISSWTFDTSTNVIWNIISSIGAVRTYVATSAGVQTDMNTNGIDIQNNFTNTITFSNNNVSQYINGNLRVTDTVANIPLGLTTLSIGSILGGSNPLYGHIKRLEIYDLALTGNEVKAL